MTMNGKEFLHMCLASGPADFRIWLQESNITPSPSSSSLPLTIFIFFIVELSSLESESPSCCPLLGGILLLKYYLGGGGGGGGQ